MYITLHLICYIVSYLGLKEKVKDLRLFVKTMFSIKRDICACNFIQGLKKKLYF